MTALSDDGSICGKVLGELKIKFPNYKWRSSLHSNVIRGFAADYNVMIVYFMMSNVFEVCLRGMNISSLTQDKDAVTALEKLRTDMYEKKRDIEKVIEDLTEKEVEGKKDG